MSNQNLKIISRLGFVPAYPLKEPFGHKEYLEGEAMCLIGLEFCAPGNHSMKAGFALNITQCFEVLVGS